MSKREIEVRREMAGAVGRHAIVKLQDQADAAGHGNRTKGAGVGGFIGGTLGSFMGPVGAICGAAIGAGIGSAIGAAADAHDLEPR